MNFSYWEHKYLLADIDFLIVGAGLVGLQTAVTLKEKESNAKVVVIDKHAWSLGASTRNAGFACFANVSEILDDLQHDTPENVYNTVKKRYLGLQKLRSKYSEAAIGYKEKGSCELFTNKNRDELSAGIDSLQGINSILDRELGLDKVFTYKSNNSLPNNIGAIHNNYEGQLNTGKLYETIYHYAQQLGIHLYNGIEVKEWNKGGTIHVLTTDSYEISTTKLILCTNGYTSKLLNEDIVPARGQVIVSEPVDKLPCEGTYMHDNGFYYWRDIDNRILLGGARNLEIEEETSFHLEPNETILSELKRFMNEQIFGREIKIEHQWSGIMGVGKANEKKPIVKELEPNVYIAARLGGMGVALSTEVAEEVVDVVLKDK